MMEQLCSEILIMFDKKCITSFKNKVLQDEKTFVTLDLINIFVVCI
jgi:hypothetical protein